MKDYENIVSEFKWSYASTGDDLPEGMTLQDLRSAVSAMSDENDRRRRLIESYRQVVKDLTS